jgi:hypothetical protein
MTKSMGQIAREIIGGTVDAKIENAKAKLNEDNQSTLKPGSGHKDPPVKLDPSTTPEQEIQDLGGNTPTKVMQRGPADAARGVKGKAAAPAPNQKYKDTPKKLAKEDKESDDKGLAETVVSKWLSGGGHALSKKKRPQEGNFTKGKGVFKGVSKKIAQPMESVELTQDDVDAFDSLTEEDFSRMLDLAENEGLSEEGQFKFAAYLDLIAEEDNSEGEVVAESTDDEEEKVETDAQESNEGEEELEESTSPEDLPITVDVSEDIAALFNGEDLSEDFKAKVSAIYEASLVKNLKHYQAQLEEQFEASLNEHLEKLTEELTTEVDSKLNYMIEEWLVDNEVAVVSGLKAEIAEEFMGGIINVLRENYVDLPDEKIDIAEAAIAQRDQLEAKLNEQISKNADLSKQLLEHAKDDLVDQVATGLTDTQTEKLRGLAEGVQFVSEEDFTKKLKTIKESYFTKGAKRAVPQQLDEEASGEIADTPVSPHMDAYVRVLGRTARK